MKKVLTIQDISCMGKCSLTVALPVISALGAETVILPTALLSTHTAFDEYTCKDLSDQIAPITSVWKRAGVRFDAIYTGYLGTISQINQMVRLFRDFKDRDNFIFVDPVMADFGKLYPAFDMEYVKANIELCSHADIIVPNLTEAAFMTGMDYRENYNEHYIKEMLNKLVEFGAGITVLTGVSLEPGKMGVMGFDRATGEYFLYQNNRVNGAFHGTGDLFSSVVVGEMLRGRDWKDAMKIAADYTALTIDVTLKDPDKPWYGVDFETTLPELIKM